jgi:hypothetical protein
MTKKLLTFIICIYTLTCAQKTTPQPQITILSQPTSSPILETTPLATPKETITNTVKDNLKPIDTIQAFCQADFNGVRTSLDTYQEVIPYVIWEVTIENDAHIVSDFKVVNSTQTEDEANIAVVYTRIGKLFEGKIESFGATSDVVTYKLIQESGRWKIQYPQPPAYISMSVAKKLLIK